MSGNRPTSSHGDPSRPGGASGEFSSNSNSTSNPDVPATFSGPTYALNATAGPLNPYTSTFSASTGTRGSSSPHRGGLSLHISNSNNTPHGGSPLAGSVGWNDSTTQSDSSPPTTGLTPPVRGSGRARARRSSGRQSSQGTREPSRDSRSGAPSPSGPPPEPMQYNSYGQSGSGSSGSGGGSGSGSGNFGKEGYPGR